MTAYLGKDTHSTPEGCHEDGEDSKVMCLSKCLAKCQSKENNDKNKDDSDNKSFVGINSHLIAPGTFSPVNTLTSFPITLFLPERFFVLNISCSLLHSSYIDLLALI